MKDYLTHQDNWKLSQLKGKSHEEIVSLYYTAFRKNQQFVSIEDEDVERSPKRLKTVEEKTTEKEDDNEEGSSHDLMMVLVPDTLYVDPIQARHPIVDWEIYKDNFGKA